MSKNIIAVFIMVAFISPVLAEKPAWAGKGKPTVEQKESHRTEMEAKEESDDDEEREKEKEEKDKHYKKDKVSKEEMSEEVKSSEEQKASKLEKPQKELDTGSEQGRESRSENSKKWWNFWGE